MQTSTNVVPDEVEPQYASTPEPVLGEQAARHEPFVANNGLLEQVTAILERQGVQVELESRREERGILRILSAERKMYTVLVQEGPAVVDVSDVRALNALVASNGSAGGYYIASGIFTPKAYDWATMHQIRLVVEDELDELSV
jgi:hypothetical protein